MIIQNSKNFLSSLGIVIEKESIHLHTQNDTSDSIYCGVLNDIKEFSLFLTKEKKGWNVLSALISKGGLFMPNPPSSIYRLEMTLKTGDKKYSYLSDFDRIRLDKILKELNATFK